MHTTHKSNFTIIKQPRNKKKLQFIEVIYAQLMGWMHLIFTQIIHV